MEILIYLVFIVVAVLPWFFAKLLGKKRLIKWFTRPGGRFSGYVYMDDYDIGDQSVVENSMMGIFFMVLPVLIVMTAVAETATTLLPLQIAQPIAAYFGYFSHTWGFGIGAGICCFFGGFSYGMALWGWLNEPGE